MPTPRVCALAGALAVVFLGACSASFGDARPAPTSTGGDTALDGPTTSTTTVPRGNVDGQLRIGTLVPMQGDGAVTGRPMAAGAALAAQDINAAGGVNGRPVLITAADEGDGPDSAAVALDSLFGTQLVDAIVGPATSRTTLGVLDKLMRAKVPVCSPAATAAALSDTPDGVTFARTIGSDVLEGTAVGSVIAQTGRQRIAILAPDDDYGRGLAEAIEAELGREGATVTAIVPYRNNDGDLAPPVARALVGSPEAVAVVGLPDPGARLLAALRNAGVRPGERNGDVLVVVTDGLRVPDLFQRVAPGQREATTGVWGVAPTTVPVEASSFVADLGVFAPDVTADYAGFAYDCTILLALAAQAAHGDDAASIARHLVDVSRGGVRCEGFAACAALLAEGRNIDYAGVMGALDLTGDGDPDRGYYDVFTYNEDGSTTVRSRSLVRLP